MTGTAKQGNALELKSNAFALRMVRLYKCLREERNEFCLSKQVLRSGTSIGANVAESKYAESGADFIHKLAVAQKETSETLFWLDLLHDGDYLSATEHASLHADCTELMKLLTSIIKARKTTLKNEKSNVNR